MACTLYDYNTFFHITEVVIPKYLKHHQDMEYEVKGGKAFYYHTKAIASPDWDIDIKESDAEKFITGLKDVLAKEGLAYIEKGTSLSGKDGVEKAYSTVKKAFQEGYLTSFYLLLLDEKKCPELGFVDIRSVPSVTYTMIDGLKISTREHVFETLQDMANERKAEQYHPDTPEDLNAHQKKNIEQFNTTYEELYENLQEAISIAKSIKSTLTTTPEGADTLLKHLRAVNKSYKEMGNLCQIPMRNFSISGCSELNEHFINYYKHKNRAKRLSVLQNQ
jgi:hypothetical protein